MKDTVWFCLGCEVQPPWKHSEKVACPTCGQDSYVKEARRFQNHKGLTVHTWVDEFPVDPFPSEEGQPLPD